MNADDHYAEAERALANAYRAVDSSKPHLEATFLRYAQVHATLATVPPTWRDMGEIAAAYDGLQRAVRTLIQSATPAAAAGYWMAPEDLMKRLAELVAEEDP